jgi:hypothetical protein
LFRNDTAFGQLPVGCTARNFVTSWHILLDSLTEHVLTTAKMAVIAAWHEV